jgi:ribosomal protein S18 acetylase RimI-like enzyme
VTVQLRPADDADLAAIGAVHVSSRDAAYAGLVPAAALHATSPDAMAAWWTERWRWERDTHRLIVAATDRAVVGFAYTGPSETAGAVELYAIHVLPGWQGRGVGRSLMRAALGALRDLGGERAVLWVLTGNERARRFYERGGWAADGATRRAPIGAELVDQVRYARWLGGST